MKIVGIDVGFGYTKVVSKNASAVFPSVVGKGKMPRFRTSLAGENGQKMVLDIDGQAYFVGNYALNQCKYVWDTRDRSRVESVEYKVLLQAGLAQVVGNDAQVNVITGLPVAHYNDESKTCVKELLIGTHLIKMIAHKPRHFMVLTAKVVIQGFGVFCRYLLDENGDWVNKDMALNGVVGIVDIGRLTTNLVLFNQLEYNEPQSSSIEVGMSVVHESLALDIEKKHGLALSLYETDGALVRGYVKVSGKKKKIGKLADPYLIDLSETINSEIRSLWGNAKALDAILISGGGAATAGALLARSYPHAQILDGLTANAEGFYRLGLHGEK